MTTTTIKPKIWVHTRTDALWYVDGDSLYEWNPSDGTPLPYLYVSRIQRQGIYRNLQSAQIQHARSGTLKLSLFCYDCRCCEDKRVLYCRDVAHCRRFKLPSSNKCDNFYWSIEGTSCVEAVHIGQTRYSLMEFENNASR